MTKSDVNDLIKKQTEELKSFIEKEIKKSQTSKEFKTEVNELIADAVVRFHRSLWSRSNLWVKDIKSK